MEYKEGDLIEYCRHGEYYDDGYVWKQARYLRVVFEGHALLQDKAGMFPWALAKIRKVVVCTLPDDNPNKTFKGGSVK